MGEIGDWWGYLLRIHHPQSRRKQEKRDERAQPPTPTTQPCLSRTTPPRNYPSRARSGAICQKPYHSYHQKSQRLTRNELKSFHPAYLKLLDSPRMDQKCWLGGTTIALGMPSCPKGIDISLPLNRAVFFIICLVPLLPQSHPPSLNSTSLSSKT